MQIELSQNMIDVLGSALVLAARHGPEQHTAAYIAAWADLRSAFAAARRPEATPAETQE